MGGEVGGLGGGNAGMCSSLASNDVLIFGE